MPITYLSPGVYVEEVPSAQQPIAGVGTSTAGFIGIVPDLIKVPVPNDWYDPHLAEIINRGEGAAGEYKDEYGRATAQLKALVDAQRAQRRGAGEEEAKVRALEADMRKATDDIAAMDAELAKTEPALPDRQKARLQRDRDRRATDQKAIETQIVEARRRVSEGVTNEDFLRPYRIDTVRVASRATDAKLCTNFTEYTERFGVYSSDDKDNLQHRALTHAVAGFFKNGGTRCWVARLSSDNADEIDRALRQFESIDEIALVAAPGLTGRTIWDKLVTHCEESKDRFAILDPPEVVGTDDELDIRALTYQGTASETIPDRNKNAAYYFPFLEVIDPAKQLQDLDPTRGIAPANRGKIYVPPSGHIAGVYARVDTERGVHKAPGNEAILGANDVKYYIGGRQQDSLNPQGVNCIRNLNGNLRVYGARTIGGDKNGEWKYVNVRRVMLFLKESIDEGTQWVVFEPNDPALWAKIRRNVGAFLTRVWRSGALVGTTPQQAVYVKCDEETNPAEVRDVGQVITEIGVAIVRPAEFVIFRVTQWAGPTKT